MTFACTNWIITLPITVIKGRSGLPPASKMELFETIIYNWKHLTTVAKSSVLDDSRTLDPDIVNVFTITVTNSFWIELDGISCQTKINFTKPVPLSASTMELFVTIICNWKLLTSVGSSLASPWLNYDFQRTEEGCSNVNSLVECVDDGRPLFSFIPNPKCNQDSYDTILETLSMSEKALRLLLNIFGNANAAARLAWGQQSILK